MHDERINGCLHSDENYRTRRKLSVEEKGQKVFSWEEIKGELDGLMDVLA